MKYILLIIFSCQIFANEGPPYQRSYLHDQSGYPTYPIESRLKTENEGLNGVEKACVIGAVSLTTLALFTAQTGFGTPTNPCIPLLAASAVGIATYVCLEW